jgi:hypothetical protein
VAAQGQAQAWAGTGACPYLARPLGVDAFLVSNFRPSYNLIGLRGGGETEGGTGMCCDETPIVGLGTLFDVILAFLSGLFGVILEFIAGLTALDTGQ